MKSNQLCSVCLCVRVIVVRFVAKKEVCLMCWLWLPSLPSLVYQFTGFTIQAIPHRVYMWLMCLFVRSFVCMCTHMCMCECIPVPASTHLYVCERERLHFFLSSHTVKSKRRLNERKTEFHDYAIQLLVCSGCVCCCWFELVYKRSSLALDISVLSDSRFTLHTIINSCLHWINRFLV